MARRKNLNTKKAYTIQIDDMQLDLIHDALELSLSIQKDDQTMTDEELEELEALVEMSNPADPELMESPALMGWTL